MKAICASVNLDLFMVLPRPTARIAHAAKLEFSSKDRSENREAGHRIVPNRIWRGEGAPDRNMSRLANEATTLSRKNTLSSVKNTILRVCGSGREGRGTRCASARQCARSSPSGRAASVDRYPFRTIKPIVGPRRTTYLKPSMPQAGYIE